MATKYIEVDTSFSTADTEPGISLVYIDRKLTLTFSSWRSEPTVVVFYDVPAFRWDESWSSYTDIAPERVYRVEESEWLERWKREVLVSDSESYVHFRLGFNAEGMFLDIIASRMEHKNA